MIAPTSAAPVASVPFEELDTSVIAPVWARYTNLRVGRGEGSWLITTSGERYLDYTSGIGVTNTGHAHPRIAALLEGKEISKVITVPARTVNFVVS